MGFLEQLLGKSEYKTCEMEINFAMEEGDEESGYIIAEIFGEEVTQSPIPIFLIFIIILFIFFIFNLKNEKIYFLIYLIIYLY